VLTVRGSQAVVCCSTCKQAMHHYCIGIFRQKWKYEVHLATGVLCNMVLRVDRYHVCYWSYVSPLCAIMVSVIQISRWLVDVFVKFMF